MHQFDRICQNSHKCTVLVCYIVHIWNVIRMLPRKNGCVPTSKKPSRVRTSRWNLSTLPNWSQEIATKIPLCMKAPASMVGGVSGVCMYAYSLIVYLICLILTFFASVSFFVHESPTFLDQTLVICHCLCSHIRNQKLLSRGLKPSGFTQHMSLTLNMHTGALTAVSGAASPMRTPELSGTVTYKLFEEVQMPQYKSNKPGVCTGPLSIHCGLIMFRLKSNQPTYIPRMVWSVYAIVCRGGSAVLQTHADTWVLVLRALTAHRSQSIAVSGLD